MTSLRVAALCARGGPARGRVPGGRGPGRRGRRADRGRRHDLLHRQRRDGPAAWRRRAAARLIPVVLELGGKSPMIVLADADLPRAAHAAVWSGFAHSGQVCIRTERVLVEESVADRFVELAPPRSRGCARAPPPLGRPDATDVDVGAITFAPQIERAEQQIADAVAARRARRHRRRARATDLPGQFFAPTLIADATPEMARHARGDLRARAAGDARRATRRTALRVANDTPMGLSGSVWSRDAGARAALARRLQAGSVCVNDALMNYFCVEAPLGGVKASGMGFRHGPEGAASVLPRRNHRRGPPAARVAVAAARPRADVPVQAPHAAAAALVHAVRFTDVEALDHLEQLVEIDRLADRAVGLQRRAPSLPCGRPR